MNIQRNIQQNIPQNIQKTIRQNFSKVPISAAQKLHQEFIRLGGMRHKLKNRMLAILPEIYKSGIYKKYAGSIVEYAGKFGDIAKTTVIKRLRLEKNLDDKPCLKAAIEKIGVHKVALVAKIATAETDKAFAENISNMSRLAVQSLSKELRARGSDKNGCSQMDFESAPIAVCPRCDENGCSQLNFENNADNFTPVVCTSHSGQTCRAVARTTKIELDEESTFLLMKLKAKLGKHLSDKEFLKLILKDRVEQEFATVAKPSRVTAKKPEHLLEENVAQKSIIDDTFFETRVPSTEILAEKTADKPSRYIPVSKKRQIIAQTNGKCSYPNCNSPFQVLHHVDRFSKSKNHDSIIPFCKIHHEFTHNNLIQNENLSAEKWQLSIIRPPSIQISQPEILYKKYRQKIFV